MPLVATGQVAYDPAHEVVRFTGRHGQLVGLRDETLDMPFVLLEVAYLKSRQLMLAKQGITTQEGGSGDPTTDHAPVPRVGSHLSLTENEI